MSTEPLSGRDAEKLLDQLHFITRDGALRTVITDTESISGIALQCASPKHPEEEGYEHQVLECCDEDVTELRHAKFAAFFVAATTAIPALLGEREQLRADRDEAVELLPDPQEETFDVAAVGRVLKAINAALADGFAPGSASDLEELMDAATHLGDRYSARITDLARQNGEAARTGTGR